MNEVQLSLDLFPGVPWDGRSPRVLTKGHLGLIFTALAPKARAISLDPRQLEFWPPEEKAPRRGAPSAPTLLPLPYEVGLSHSRRRDALCHDEAGSTRAAPHAGVKVGKADLVN